MAEEVGIATTWAGGEPSLAPEVAKMWESFDFTDGDGEDQDPKDQGQDPDQGQVDGEPEPTSVDEQGNGDTQVQDGVQVPPANQPTNDKVDYETLNRRLLEQNERLIAALEAKAKAQDTPKPPAEPEIDEIQQLLNADVSDDDNQLIDGNPILTKSAKLVLKQYHAKMAAKLKDLEDKVARNSSRVESTAGQAFMNRVQSEIADFAGKTNDAGWHTYLNSQVPMYQKGVTFGSLLQLHYNNQDVDGLKEVFDNFQPKSKTTPTSASTKPVAIPPAGQGVKVSTEPAKSAKGVSQDLDKAVETFHRLTDTTAPLDRSKVKGAVDDMWNAAFKKYGIQ